MNLTLAADRETVERVRRIARRQGTSLNALIRSYLEMLASREADSASVEALFALMDEGGGDLKGRRPTRDDAHER